MHHKVRRISTTCKDKWYRQVLVFELFEESSIDKHNRSRVIRISTNGTALDNGFWAQHQQERNFCEYILNIYPAGWSKEEESKPGRQPKESWVLTDFSPTVQNKTYEVGTSTSIGASLGSCGDMPTGGVSTGTTTSSSQPIYGYQLASRVGESGDHWVQWSLKGKVTTKDLPGPLTLNEGVFKPRYEAIFTLDSGRSAERYTAFETVATCKYGKVYDWSKGSEFEVRATYCIGQRYIVDWQEQEVYAVDPMTTSTSGKTDFPNLAPPAEPTVDISDRFSYRPLSPVGTSLIAKSNAEITVPADRLLAYSGGFTIGSTAGSSGTRWVNSKKAVQVENATPLVWITPERYRGGFITHMAKDSAGVKVTSFDTAQDAGIPEVPDGIWQKNEITPIALWANGTYSLEDGLADNGLHSFSPTTTAETRGITAGFLSGPAGNAGLGRGFLVKSGALFGCDGIKLIDSSSEEWKVSWKGLAHPVFDAIAQALGTPVPTSMAGIWDPNHDPCVFMFADNKVAALNLSTLDTGTPMLFSADWVDLVRGTAGTKFAGDISVSSAAAKFVGLREDYPVSGYVPLKGGTWCFTHPVYSAT
ncbi:hypothetical protein [Streptomyces sp. NBC_01304]|uniref:hypothetical protein n=1 Tax=Streptomyces sp. NBC_01304 TaxID=2903818 RepID=UPI002E128E47|nr:hypothetical protein OG430_42160 [Streptomyces sp. NBC_01304]